jgi:putative phosphoesterase
MTTLAVLADIHGNSLALEATLADLDAVGGADYLLVLGDLAVFGPNPAGVLNLLREHTPIFYVRGNTDRYLIEEKYPGEPGDQTWQAQVLASFPWTATQLGADGLRFLTSLPSHQILCLDSEHTILAVHASPRSDEENIRPETPEAELTEMLDGFNSFNLLLCGHTHLAVDREVAGRRIINVGSVGLPFDGDSRASYALVHLQPNGQYHVEFRRVAYDVEAVVTQLTSIAHPTADVSAYNLRFARPLGQKLVYTEQMRRGETPKTTPGKNGN